MIEMSVLGEDQGMYIENSLYKFFLLTNP